tara:strand:+ start:15528 stop:17018 length:1491 start_codon:yes stop_codon:yes gene_type:complete
MKNFIIFWPDKEIKNELWNQKNIFFFDTDGLVSYFEGDKRVVKNIFDEKPDYNFFSDGKNKIEDMVEDYRNTLPMWSRFSTKGDTYEVNIRRAILQIIKLSTFLKNNKIYKAIFYTGIVHHQESLITSKACKICSIDQIFLSVDILEYRLLPLIEKKNLSDNRFINSKLFKINYEQSLDDFIQITKSGHQPKHYNKISIKDLSIIYAIIYFYFYHFPKRIIHKFFKFMKLTKSSKRYNLFDYLNNEYLFNDVDILLRHFHANKFYKSKVVKFNNDNKKKDIKIIFFAHSQPEASTFPLGLKLGNHIDSVIKIRELGYSKKIFYKEHYGSFVYSNKIRQSNWDRRYTRTGIYRTLEYYKNLLDLNCQFTEIDSKLFFKKECENMNLFPITVTGTIALQRALCGFKTIIMGHIWWSKIPGVIHINDIRDLNTIDINFIKHSDEIEKQSKKFLLDILNNNTMSNFPGIGTGRQTHDEQIKKNFLNEIKSLLEYLDEKKI